MYEGQGSQFKCNLLQVGLDLISLKDIFLCLVSVYFATDVAICEAKRNLQIKLSPALCG